MPLSKYGILQNMDIPSWLGTPTLVIIVPYWSYCLWSPPNYGYIIQRLTMTCILVVKYYDYNVVPPSYKLVYKPHEYYSYIYHKPSLLDLLTNLANELGHHFVTNHFLKAGAPVSYVSRCIYLITTHGVLNQLSLLNWSITLQHRVN